MISVGRVGRSDRLTPSNISMMAPMKFIGLLFVLCDYLACVSVFHMFGNPQDKPSWFSEANKYN
jgi:hypothetical protein